MKVPESDRDECEGKGTEVNKQLECAASDHSNVCARGAGERLGGSYGG